MISLAENAAVTDPRKALSAGEKRALLAIRDYRSQITLTTGALIGPLRVPGAVIRALQLKQLIRGYSPKLALTAAGALAVDKLRPAARSLPSSTRKD